jgi:hypothetical protein
VKVREMGSMWKEGVSRIVKAVIRESMSELMRAVQLRVLDMECCHELIMSILMDENCWWSVAKRYVAHITSANVKSSVHSRSHCRAVRFRSAKVSSDLTAL